MNKSLYSNLPAYLNLKLKKVEGYGILLWKFNGI